MSLLENVTQAGRTVGKKFRRKKKASNYGCEVALEVPEGTAG